MELLEATCAFKVVGESKEAVATARLMLEYSEEAHQVRSHCCGNCEVRSDGNIVGPPQFSRKGDRQEWKVHPGDR